MNVTEGCVAFYNNDILKIKNWLDPYQSAVVISSDHSKLNRKSDVTELRFRFQNWLNAWDDKRIKDYLSFYDHKFKLRNRDFKQFAVYKKRVFNSYDSISVKAKRLKILTHEKYAVTAFNQDFAGDNRYRSIGSKTIYWIKKDGNWFILAEIFSDQEFEPKAVKKEKLIALLGGSAAEKLGFRRSSSEQSNF